MLRALLGYAGILLSMARIPEGRKKKKDNSRRTHMSHSEEGIVIGRTLAIAKGVKAIQIGLSENGNVFLILQRNSKGQAAFVPKCIQEFR